MNDKITYYAVLTGDIIGFTKFNEPTKINIQDSLSNISKYLADYPDIGFEYINVFRGDSWQVLLSKPEKSLFFCIFIRAFLKAKLKNNHINTRISVAISSIDFPGTKDIAGDGQAFRLSGLGLDKINTQSNQIVFTLGEPYTKSEKEINVLIGLIDFVTSQWSYKQSEIILKSLLEYTVREIAEQFDRSFSTINKHQLKAGWKNIQDSMEYFADYVSGIYS